MSCRKLYARSPGAKALGYKAGDFSYNTGKLRCPVCDGTGSISLDVQFLPDVDIPLPGVPGFPIRKGCGPGAAQDPVRGGVLPCPELMDMDIHMALDACTDWKVVRQRLQVLEDLGPGLSDPWGGHPQPLRRGGPAAEAGQRDGPGPGGHGLCL